MAQVPMVDAVLGGTASSAEYNNVTANVRDLATRISPLETASSVSKVLVRAVYPTQNTALTAAASVETDIPKLAVTSLSVTNGRRYRFDYYLNVQGSTANDGIDINLRLTTPVSGTLLGSRRFVIPNIVTASSLVASFYYTAVATTTLSFYVSHIRTTGSGTTLIYQDAAYRNFVEAYDTGAPGNGVVVNVA